MTDEEQRLVAASRMGLIDAKTIDLGSGKCYVEFYIGDEIVTWTFLGLIIKGVNVTYPNVKIELSKE